MPDSVKIWIATRDEEIDRCFPVMVQLRPHLARREFVERVRRMQAEGFRLVALEQRGVVRAVDLPQSRHGRRVRVAGAVITRQRPGTAKGFVFLTIEDETGLANIIVKPDVFDAQRRAIVSEPFLLIEGALQIQDGVTSVRAERVQPLFTTLAPLPSHDFH